MQFLLGVLGYIVFICVGCFCMKIAKDLFNTYLNITSILILPFLLVCSFQLLTTFFYESLIIPGFEYWSIITVFFVATLLVETIFHIIFKIDVGYVPLFNGGFETNRNFMFFVLVYLIYMLYDTYHQVVNVDMSMLLQDDFSEEYGGSGGFISRLFLMICAAYFFGCNNTKAGFLLGVICLIPSVVINTKGVILIPVIASFFVKEYYGRLVNLKKTLLIVGIVGISIFIGSYMWEFFTVGGNPLADSEKWKLVFDKLVSYVISGVQGFCINLQDPGEYSFDDLPNITMTPINNFLSKLGVGSYISSVNPVERTMGLASSDDPITNVNSHIGTLYLFNGLFIGLLIHSFWIMVTLLIKKICQKTGSVFFVLLYSLFLAGFAFGWFELYFMHTFWLYLIIITVLLYIVFNCHLFDTDGLYKV